ncbi:hypothetical protein PIROE2DRAFT_16130 [Piromyces sp. E2]|nr:hypothetical protein PIROE2DRAFT_16130 [Piromyces sp. E2]|eukprot:OUM58559.1 hypothetical protein PIROE2DRAFT_16130 [Piromyces sp. E2]
MKNIFKERIYFILLFSIYILISSSRVIILSNNDSSKDNKILTLNNYKAYKYEKVKTLEGKNKLSTQFSFNISSNNTVSIYLFSEKQYQVWNNTMRTLENNKNNTISIETLVNKEKSLKHLDWCDCSSKVKSCKKSLCKIDEEIFYLVIFGYQDFVSYELTDIEGDFYLMDIIYNGKSSIFPSKSIAHAKAYKTSFVGMTENDNENKEINPDKENDIFKKMIYIALIVIPSIIIFLVLLFIYCHRGYKVEKESNDRLYNPKEEDKKLRFKSFTDNSRKKLKKKNINHVNDSTTLPNDRSKISTLNSPTHSKGASTLYGNSMENINSSASLSSVSEEPFGGNYISKKLDHPYNENISPQANINVPYNDDTGENHYFYHHDHSMTNTYNSRKRMMDEKEEDIVNTSIGHVEGEEFDNTKNIYIKINRSTNKYNTEEYLKEDSINKIKEKHSCITQLSHFFNEEKDASLVDDDSSSSLSSSSSSSSSSSKSNTNSKRSSSTTDTTPSSTNSSNHNDNPNINNNNTGNGATTTTTTTTTTTNKKKKNRRASGYLDKHIESIKSLEDDDVDKDNEESLIEEESFISELCLPPLAQAHPAPGQAPGQVETQEQVLNHTQNTNSNSVDYATSFKNRNLSSNTFGNSFASDESRPSPPLTPPLTTPTSNSKNSKSTSKGYILGRLLYTFYYSSTRILNVDEVVKIKKVYENNWVKVERNPNEFFIIPLLVVRSPYEDLRLFKMRCRKRRYKVDKEDVKISERVEPTPEYLYNCAYISKKDYQKMNRNVKWANLIKSLDHSHPQHNMITPSSSKPTTPTLPKTIHHSSRNTRSKKTQKVDLQPFMDSTTTKNKNSSQRRRKKNVTTTTTQKINSFIDSSIEGINVNVSSSQDDIELMDKRSTIKDEEFYHFENISDPGMLSKPNSNPSSQC